MAARKSSKSRRAPPELPRTFTYSLQVAVETSDNMHPPQNELRREIRPSNLFRSAWRLSCGEQKNAKFVFRSALRPNQISFSHSQDGVGTPLRAATAVAHRKNLEFSVFVPDFTRLLIIWGAVDHAMGECHGQGFTGCRVRFLDRAYRRVP